MLIAVFVMGDCIAGLRSLAEHAVAGPMSFKQAGRMTFAAAPATISSAGTCAHDCGRFIDRGDAYERRPFDLGEVFDEAQEGGGSRMICSTELSLLVDYARTRDAAVTNVETYELRGVLEVPRIDLGISGLDERDEGLTDAQRLELAAGNVSEVLALAEAEGHRFGYRVWVWLNADR